MSFPTETELAQMICDHLDRDDPEVNPPTDSDHELARKIRDRIDTGIYFDRLSDVHGLHLFFRRLIGGALIGVLALILILTTHWSAR
jgi:hypothetical protein